MNVLSGGWAAVRSAHATGCALDDTCRHCAAEAPCHFRGVNGLLRLACKTRGRQVDPTLCRNGGLDDEGAEYWAFGSPPVSPSGSRPSKVMRLRHSAGQFPKDRGVWCRRPVT